jgi:hypothetical protein
VNQALQDIHNELDTHDEVYNETKTPTQSRKNPPLSVYASTHDRLPVGDSTIAITTPAIKALWKNGKYYEYK